MRIGIVSNHYICNYGSVLQSFALQVCVDQLGYINETINYQDVADKKTKLEILLRLKAKELLNIKKLIKKIKIKQASLGDRNYSQVLERRKHAYDKFVTEYFRLSKKCARIEDVQRLSKEYDTILLSSDQLWGPTDLMRDYHTLTPFSASAGKIAYATSFGVSSLPRFLYPKVKNFIPQIDYVSVREKSGQKIIRDICGREVPVVLDPTLLLTAAKWKEIIQEKMLVEYPYVFCYFLGENVEYIKMVKQFCASNHLKIVSVLHPEFYNREQFRFADEYLDGVGPAEFLNLIEHAEYVISDSFHASVFSILFHRQFAVFNRYGTDAKHSRNTRIENLLDITDLHLQHIINQRNIDDALSAKIDWTSVDCLLERKRADSLDYLKNALKGCEEKA